MECPICYVDIREDDIYKTYCDHSFHEECILRWFQYSHSCPMCRTSKFEIPIKEYEKNYWTNNKKMKILIEQCKYHIFKI